MLGLNFLLFLPPKAGHPCVLSFQLPERQTTDALSLSIQISSKCICAVFMKICSGVAQWK